VGLAWIDLSTGTFQAAVVRATRLADELARIQPTECLVSEGAATSNGTVGPATSPALWGTKLMLTERPDWCFSQKAARDVLGKQFGTASLEGFGFTDEDGPAI